jgi:DNA replication protein DnaC
LTRAAHFPFFKTIDDFDFTLQSTLRLSRLGSYLGPDFVTEGRSLILYGKEGRGKTHLAVALGYRAIQNGFETLCTTAAKLIEDLSNASQQGHLHQSLATYTHPHVLVIDEVGYLTYGPDAANILFHVVNDRHLRKRPMIFTTNKPLRQWGRVLHDEDLAAAILDHILERGRFIQLDGPSGRTRHLNLEDTLPSGAHHARISGTHNDQTPTNSLRKLRPEIEIRGCSTVQKANCLYLRGTVSAARQLGLNSISFLAADITSDAFNRPGGWSTERQSTVALGAEETRRLEQEVDLLIREHAYDIATGLWWREPRN